MCVRKMDCHKEWQGSPLAIKGSSETTLLSGLKSQNHFKIHSHIQRIITEWLRLEGTSGDIWSSPPCSGPGMAGCPGTYPNVFWIGLQLDFMPLITMPWAWLFSQLSVHLPVCSCSPCINSKDGSSVWAHWCAPAPLLFANDHSKSSW